MDAVPYIALLSAVAGLLLAAFFYTKVKEASPGNERMVFLMEKIQKGARAFLEQEYTWVAGFVAIMAILDIRVPWTTAGPGARSSTSSAPRCRRWPATSA